MAVLQDDIDGSHSCLYESAASVAIRIINEIISQAYLQVGTAAGTVCATEAPEGSLLLCHQVINMFITIHTCGYVDLCMSSMLTFIFINLAGFFVSIDHPAC